MRLPLDILSGNYKKPRFFLCNTDKEKICQLLTTDTSGSFKFNGLSELSFEVSRFYEDEITGEINVNPYYAQIEAFRLVFVEGFGYFELKGPEITGDGIKEAKICTAYSLEYVLSTKYIDNFNVNTGKTGSIEVTYAEDVLGDINKIIPVTLYNPNNTKLSLLHLVLEKVYGWSIGHVDKSLQTLSRQFEIDRESVYDFLINEVCEKFNCYIVFDTINNTINIYAESLTAKFIGDGTTSTFIISPPFAEINTVSVNGYKTTRWSYNNISGALVLEDIPPSGALVEVVDGALTEWETDVFVSFDNLAQGININYESDDIKTVLTVTYGDEGTIREVNLGLPYLTDLSYYYTVDWMGQDLYDAYTKYLQKSNKVQSLYANNSQEILKLNDQIYYEKTRLSLEYSLVQSVNSTTVGTYYVRRENADGTFYYKEVSLPNEYNANENYYSNVTANVTEDKVSDLYAVLKKYFNNENEDKHTDNQDITSWKTDLNELTEAFEFMETYTLNYLSTELSKVSTNRIGNQTAETAINNFLSEIWEELGKTPLEELYLKPYIQIQETNIEAGWSNRNDKRYPYYYPVTLYIRSIESAIKLRDETIKSYEKQRSVFEKNNAEISDSLLMTKNFTKKQLIKLSAFLREDELVIDDIIETSQDDLSSSFKVKQDAMESGRIELQKRCQPQLQFSMTMANIYALPEFEPIVHQFQLGKVIKVALRPDYIKQSRLLQVDINFDDFSDFSCEFGELTDLRTQSDIHADLLSKAITAGKSVATNSSYWTRGADTATTTDLKIQQGLLDATTQIKAIDGSQGVVIDKYGIKLQKMDPNTGELDPHQTWMTNNMILMSDDGFKTSRSALGQITVDGNEYYGLIAEMVLSGYIESSNIVGGTIKIGENESGKPVFEVDEDGHVTMNAASISGYATSKEVSSAIEQQIGQIKLSVEDSENGSMISLTNNDVVISSGEIKLNGFVTFNSLEDSNSFTTINGANITTGNINGGTIKIGEYTDQDGNTKHHFEVDEDGNVTMSAGNTIEGYAKTEDLNSFEAAINTDISNLQSQIDGKARSWYQPTDPSLTWDNTEDHSGDLWYNSSSDSQVTYIYSDGAWKQTSVPQSLFDTIDGIASIYVTVPNNPVVGDLLIPTSDIKDDNTGDVLYKTGKVYKYNGTSWVGIDYTDDTRAEEVYEYASSIEKTVNGITLSVSDGSIGNKASIKLEIDEETKEATIDLTGAVTFTDLETNGSTKINGSYITTGTISAERLDIKDIFAQNVTATGLINFSNSLYSLVVEGYSEDANTEPTFTIHSNCDHMYIQSISSIHFSSQYGMTFNSGEVFCGRRGTAIIDYAPYDTEVTVNFFEGMEFYDKFSEPPTVIIQQVFNEANILVENVTTTGFKAKLGGNFDTSGTRQFSWVAIGF